MTTLTPREALRKHSMFTKAAILPSTLTHKRFINGQTRGTTWRKKGDKIVVDGDDIVMMRSARTFVNISKPVTRENEEYM